MMHSTTMMIPSIRPSIFSFCFVIGRENTKNSDSKPLNRRRLQMQSDPACAKHDEQHTQLKRLYIIPLHCALERPPAAAMDRVRHVCASFTCATAEKYDADRLCAGCRSVFYCSPECQCADWKGHKPACRVATAEREASQIVRVGKGGESAPPAAAPERVGPPASQWVAGAARGEAEALYNLGCCYDTGKGVRAPELRAGGQAVEAGRG
jgi:hypothetical protein